MALAPRSRRILGVLAALLGLVVLGPWALSRLAARPVTALHLTDVTAPTSGHGADTLRVGTFNIAHGRGLSSSNWTGEGEGTRQARLEEIAELLRGADLDVVVLNEVDFASSWSRGVDQAQRLARAAGFPFLAEAPNLDVRAGPLCLRFGNAVLSRAPLTEAEVIELPAYSRLEALLAGKKRGLAVTVDAPSGAFRLLAVHLSHRSETLRAASTRLLVELARSSALPTVIAGDLNSTPPGFPPARRGDDGENALELLDRAGLFRRHPLEAPTPAQLTFHSQRPTSVIDWIVIPEAWSFEGYEASATVLSDHRPVFATVRR